MNNRMKSIVIFITVAFVSFSSFAYRPLSPETIELTKEISESLKINLYTEMYENEYIIHLWFPTKIGEHFTLETVYFYQYSKNGKRVLENATFFYGSNSENHSQLYTLDKNLFDIEINIKYKQKDENGAEKRPKEYRISTKSEYFLSKVVIPNVSK